MQKHVNKTLSGAVILNAKKGSDNGNQDEITKFTRLRKEQKQYQWIKKAMVKPCDKTDVPKTYGTERITILSTKLERQSMQKTSDGDYITKNLPPRFPD